MEEEKNVEIKNEVNIKRKKIIPLIIVVIIIVLAMIISTIFALININNTKIMNGVYIEGIDVSNLTVEDATKKVNDNLYKIINCDLNLNYKEDVNIVKVNQLKTEFDVENAIIEAYNIGRNKNIIINNYEIIGANLFKKTIDLRYTIDEEETNKILEDIESKLEGVVIQNSYYIVGEELIITRGKEGIKIVKDKTINDIKQNIDDRLYGIEKSDIIFEIVQVKPDKLDLEKIRSEIFKEPKDAYYTENPFKIYPEVDGVDFNITIEEANNIIKEEKEEYRIPLKITKPKVTINQISASVFPSTISTFTTKYDASAKGRSKNISMAAETINGKVLLPGESFSFNGIVGNTTKEKGYQLATSYISGKMVQDYGGGICQVSTTLYNAVLRANLEVLSRRNHSYIVSYVDIGTDATIAYPTTDFQFKNNRNYAIKIVASARNGILKIDILGVKEEVEYEVVIESEITQVIPYSTKTTQNSSLPEGTQNVLVKGVNVYKSVTYKILKQNGTIISKTLISEDTYKPMAREVEVGTKKTVTTNTLPVSENVLDGVTVSTGV